MASVNDRPANIDKLGIEAYKNALVEFIKQAEMPMTVAIQGEWGSGKTTLMQKIKEDLNSVFYPIWINVWQYSFSDNKKDILSDVSSNIIEQISNYSHEPKMQEAAKELKKYIRTAINLSANMITKNFIGENFGNILNQISEKKDIESIRNDIENFTISIIKKGKEKGNSIKGFIVFIDDLDRMDPVIAVNLLEILKTLFDISNCVFLLAIDYDVVKKGLASKFGEYSLDKDHEFRSFFDKIIQVPFFMPVSKYEVDTYIKDILESTNLNFSPDDNYFITKFIKTLTGLNPRSIKKILNYYSLNRILVNDARIHQDVDLRKIHFLLICIQVEFPLVYLAIENNSDILLWKEELLDVLNIKNENIPDDDYDNDEEEWKKVLRKICLVTNESYSKTEGLCKILEDELILIKDKSKDVKDCLKLTSVTNVNIKENIAVRNKWAIYRNNNIINECRSMGAVAFEVIKHYIENNNVESFEKLKSVFDPHKVFKQPIIAKCSDISDNLNKNTNGKCRKKNYWSNLRGFLSVGGTEFGVSTQWVIEKNNSALYFNDFINIVNSLGYDIKVIE